MTEATKNCENCGNEFTASLKELSRTSRPYCSRECYHAARKLKASERAEELSRTEAELEALRAELADVSEASRLAAEQKRAAVLSSLYGLNPNNLAEKAVLALLSCLIQPGESISYAEFLSTTGISNGVADFALVRLRGKGLVFYSQNTIKLLQE